MIRQALVALATGATLFGATAAQAGTSWSIGINLPPADVYVSNGPRYYEPAPVYYEPAPVVRYVPAPRYVERNYYYAPPRVVYEQPHHHHGWDRRNDHWDNRRDNDRWDRDRGRDNYGPQRGGRW